MCGARCRQAGLHRMQNAGLLFTVFASRLGALEVRAATGAHFFAFDVGQTFGREAGTPCRKGATWCAPARRDGWRLSWGLLNVLRGCRCFLLPLPRALARWRYAPLQARTCCRCSCHPPCAGVLAHEHTSQAVVFCAWRGVGQGRFCRCRCFYLALCSRLGALDPHAAPGVQICSVALPFL